MPALRIHYSALTGVLFWSFDLLGNIFVQFVFHLRPSPDHYYYYYYGSPRSANAVFEKLETDLTKSGSTSGTCVIGNLCLGQFVVNINLGDCRSAYVADSGRRAERSC